MSDVFGRCSTHGLPYDTGGKCAECRKQIFVAPSDPTPAGTGPGEPSEWPPEVLDALARFHSVFGCYCDNPALAAAVNDLVTAPRAAPVAADARPDETRCEDGQLPDGPVCPKCGGARAPSGINGGSWVHARPEAGAPDDLRDEIERMKRNTVDVIDRGKEPYLNGASLVILFDKILTRIEALEAHRAATPPGAASGTRGQEVCIAGHYPVGQNGTLARAAAALEAAAANCTGQPDCPWCAEAGRLARAAAEERRDG